MKRQMQE
jgi:hypothetical protein